MRDSKSNEKAESLPETSRPEERVEPVANPDADSDFEIDSEDSDVEEEKVKPALDESEVTSKADTRKREEKEEQEEAAKSKFVKRTGSETVMSARERYLARKAARDTTKTHVSREDN